MNVAGSLPSYTPYGSKDKHLRPTDWDDYVGQAALKRRLGAHISAAFAERRPIEHMLLDGPPGSGKTTIADLIAVELGDDIRHVPRPVSVDELADVLMDLSTGVLFIDEIQMWTKRQQEDLLVLLEDGVLRTKWCTVQATGIAVIAATTERERLTPALEDRFLVQSWDPYTDDEMAEIISRMAERAGVELSEEAVGGLARAACGSPRQCRRLVFAARALSYVSDGPVTATAVLEHAQIDADGLGRLELAYLGLLAHHTVPVGLEIITDTLGAHRSRVRAAERLVVARGYVRRTKSGRILTSDGRRRVAGHRPSRLTA